MAWGQLHGQPVLATGSDDRTIRLWTQPDVSTTLRLTEPVFDIAFSPDGSIAISGASGFAIVKHLTDQPGIDDVGTRPRWPGGSVSRPSRRSLARQMIADAVDAGTPTATPSTARHMRR